jgi:hypothetical protein
MRWAVHVQNAKPAMRRITATNTAGRAEERHARNAPLAGERIMNVIEHVSALLAEPVKVDLGHGRHEDLMPGPECRTCKGTGYVVLHGAPPSRFGPRLDPGCPACHRDPLRWLSERVQAKMVQLVLRSNPELR